MLLRDDRSHGERGAGLLLTFNFNGRTTCCAAANRRSVPAADELPHALYSAMCPKSGLMHRSKFALYSIRSSTARHHFRGGLSRDAFCAIKKSYFQDRD
jgi:hypothetical protein